MRRFLKKLIKTNTIQQLHTWVYIQRKLKQGIKETYAPPCSLQHYSQYSRFENNPSVCEGMPGWRWWTTHTPEQSGILCSHEKKVNPAIYNNMDWPLDHYVKWNKPDRGRQILHVYSYVESNFFKKSNSYKEKKTGCEGVVEIGKRVQTQL